MSGFPKPKVVPISAARRAKRNASLGELMAEDLARSGIDPKTAKKLKIRACDPDEAWALLHPKNPDGRPKDFTAEVAWFPYWNPDGSQINNYGRARILRGQWSAEDDGKRNRYRNPVNTLPHVYVPVPILDDLKVEAGKIVLAGAVTITEGEKKGIAAWQCGIPAIALGGIDAEGTARHLVTLIEEFNWFDWSQLDAEICFDSDVYGAKEGTRALYALGYTLRREKHPKSLHYVRLTTEGHEKTALDDFLATFGDRREAARRAYYQLPRRADEIAEAFAKYDSEIVQVRKRAKYYNTAHRTFYPRQSSIVEEYGVGQTVPSADGKKRVLPITLWLTERNPKLTTVMDVVYAPGKPARYKAAAGDEHDTLNEWRPTSLVPVPYKGDEDSIRPWLELLEYMTPKLTDEERDWFIDWQAYPLQNVGGKTHQAVLIWSESQGSGKNTIANALRPMHGAKNLNWQVINGKSLMSDFNEWALRQFVVINEVHMPSYGEQKAVMGCLQTLITEDTIDHSRKYFDRQSVPNYVNFFLTSNHEDALRLAEDDRRFFVVKGPSIKDKWPEKKFVEFYRWLDNGGRERVFGYLLARRLDNFNPHGAAPRTAARTAMVRGTDGVLGDLITILNTSPAQIMFSRRRDGTVQQRLEWDLYTPARIVEAINRYASEHNMRLVNLTDKALGAVMGKHAFVKRRLEIDGKNVTAYALFNADSWAKKSKAEWREHLKEQLK